MKKISKFLMGFGAIFGTPLVAFAAGTYYTGGYQSPQQRYNAPSYTQQQNGYARPTVAPTQNNGTYSNSGYSRYQPTTTTTGQVQQQRQTAVASNNKKQGFYLDAGLSRETAQWEFEMNQSGSKLHYNNIAWNVFDVNGGYGFNMGNTPAQIDVGLKIGMQAGETTMVDDDITNGGYLVTTWVDTNGDIIGNQVGHALSIGTSDGGSMMGFNVGFGLTDFFTIGRAKITPSIGYRHFSYKLETSNNYGMSLDTAACFKITTDGKTEIQCDPAIIAEIGGTQEIIWRPGLVDGNGDPIEMEISGAGIINPGGTYYYEQGGVSHSYEVAWSGPYAAMDIRYDINQNNSVDGRVELGLPGYTATGDQPYRFDWAHPKSVEDSAGMGSAIHFGMGANWRTALTDTIMLSVGLTYDYYSVSGADATTYLNEEFYTKIYNERLDIWQTAGKTEADMLDTNLDVNGNYLGDATAINIKATEAQCPGWECKMGSEIESFYKSMGIRVGLNARF